MPFLNKLVRAAEGTTCRRYSGPAFVLPGQWSGMDREAKDSKGGDSGWKAPQAPQPETDAYHIWKPRPLLRSVHWRPVEEVSGDEAAGAYELFLDQRAFSAMHEHVWNAPAEEEPFGYLVGDLCEDPETGRRYVIVSSVVPSRSSYREDAEEQIQAESDVSLKLEADRRRGILVGWYHRHLSGSAALSARDLATFDRLFPQPWQVALLFVADPSAPAGACFARTPEGLSAERGLAFYEMVANESLRARGVRLSRLDWTNVATSDPVQSDPPPRPRSIPERQEKPAVEGTFPTPRPDEDQPMRLPGEDDESLDRPEPEHREQAEPADVAPIVAITEGDLDFDALVAEVVEADVESQTQDVPPEERAGPLAADISEVESVLPEAGSTSGPAAGAPPEGVPTGPTEEPPRAIPDLPKVAIAGRQRRWGRGTRRALATVTGFVVVVAVGVSLVTLVRGNGSALDQLGPATDENASAHSDRVPDEAVSLPEEGGAPEPEQEATAEIVSAERFQALGEDLLESISRFYGSVVALDQGAIGCAELQGAYVEVEDRWIAYSMEGRGRWEGRLPEALAERDERLYQGVRDAEQEFGRSGCERP